MYFDLTQWFVMPSVKAGKMLPNGSVYGRETHHLEGTKLDGITPAEKEYHVDTGYSLWFVKSPQGYPWDVKPYDTTFIYDRVTELDWTQSGGKNFKQFNPMLGICSRFWDGTPDYEIYASSNYDVYKNCQKQNTTQSVNAVRYTIEGPANVDFGGDVGNVPAIMICYYWNGSGTPLVYNDREELYLTQQVGWVKWTHAKLVNGVHEFDDATLHNRIVAGALTAPPVFPCLVIP